MLDTDQQVKAYRALRAAGGVHPAASVTLAATVKTAAAGKAANLTTATKPPAGATYPASITALISTIGGMGAHFTAAATAADAFHAAIDPWDDIQELIRMSIGFDVHIKEQQLAKTTVFPLVTAIADTQKVAALNTAVNGVDITAIVAAMGAINTQLTPAAPVPPATVGVAKTLTQAQIDALTKAVNDQKPHDTPVTTATADLNTLTNSAKTSITQAETAFKDGVTIALIVSLKADPRMAGAITALIPANVLAELNKQP
ncbi:TPA: hypothetical protein ACGQ50_000857 [Enterobacter cloacae]